MSCAVLDLELAAKMPLSYNGVLVLEVWSALAFLLIGFRGARPTRHENLESRHLLARERPKHPLNDRIGPSGECSRGIMPFFIRLAWAYWPEYVTRWVLGPPDVQGMKVVTR